MSGGQRRTVGVEEEFLLLDGQGVPTPAAAAAAVIAQAAGFVGAELQQQQVEIASRPATDLDVIAADLLQARQHLAKAAGHAGVRAAGLATSPFPVHPIASPTARFQRLLATHRALSRICGAFTSA